MHFLDKLVLLYNPQFEKEMHSPFSILHFAGMWHEEISCHITFTLKVNTFPFTHLRAVNNVYAQFNTAFPSQNRNPHHKATMPLWELLA